MSWFEFAGMSTADIPGLTIEAKTIHGLPERDIEKVHVPGRDGDFVIDHGSYKNVIVSYQCAVTRYSALLTLGRMLCVGKLSGTIYTPWRGYQLLRDGFSNFERLAVSSQQVSMEEAIANRLMRFVVTFDCKPRKYNNRAASVGFAYTPENVIQHIGVITDAPYMFDSISTAMRIEVVGTGEVGFRFERGGIITVPDLVASNVIEGSNPVEYEWPSLVIDSEAMVAYRSRADGTKENIELPFFPSYFYSYNFTLISGRMYSLKIFPRWWAY